MAKLSLGVDVGGTFTDFILVDEELGKVSVGKRLTTPRDPSEAIVGGTDELLRANGAVPSALGRFVHGTTLVTNTIIERKGAATALLTTRGYKDTLVIGKPLRYDLYDLFLEFPESLVPRFLRFDIDERLSFEGNVLRPLDEAQVLEAVGRAVEAGVTALAICFLHSYRNPVHERRARDIIQAAHPGLTISLSADVVAEIGEYERTSTTVANAYVQPLMSRYLDRLQSELDQRDMKAPLHLMLSSGGITTVDVARQLPIQLIESGPAAGAIAATYSARSAGEADVLSFDMGGTTAKMCLITKGEPAHSNHFEAARVQRFMRGSGLPLKVPVIELIEIGAGGGSMARVDRMGLLKVGPQSAGADPGPACYGRGGTQPTVTDADVVLGFVDPKSFLGGRMELDVAAARRAIEEHVARPLGMTVTEGAVGIHNIVNEMMASATRVYAAERGCDHRQYSMIAFGGAGPVHAVALARLLKIRRVICPPAAGAASALGFLLAPAALELAQSYVTRIHNIDWAHVRGMYAELDARATEMLAGTGVAADQIQFRRVVEMSYVGQGFQISVEPPAAALAGDTAALEAAFRSEYVRLYGRTINKVAIQVLTWRLSARGPQPAAESAVLKDAPSGALIKGRRAIYLADKRDYAEVPVYDRYQMRAGLTFEGPAVVEENESTFVLGAECSVRVDETLNLIVDLAYGSAA